MKRAAVSVALNEDVRQDLLHGQFITLFAALLTPSIGALTVARAGHHPGLHLRFGAQTTTALMGKTDTALGLFGGKRFRDLLSPIDMKLESAKDFCSTRTAFLKPWTVTNKNTVMTVYPPPWLLWDLKLPDSN
jgi:Stage II sporulation protein E (SpoIIE)